MRGFYLIAILVVLTSVRFKTNDSFYAEMFEIIKMNPKDYDEIYLMHFDFCSPDTKCKDTLELGGYLNNPSKRVALIVDTLYSSRIPAYIELGRQHIYYINRQWLQRKGIYTEFQQRLVVSGKGKFKKRKILK